MLKEQNSKNWTGKMIKYFFQQKAKKKNNVTVIVQENKNESKLKNSFSRRRKFYVK